MISGGELREILETADIKLRPKANSGFYLLFLLPLCIVLLAFKFSGEAYYVYKICAAVSFGFVLTSLLFLYNSLNTKRVENNGAGCVLVSLIITIYLIVIGNRGILFSSYSGLLSGWIYQKFLLFLLKSLPFSFTFGEATVVSQAILLLLYTTILNLFDNAGHVPTTVYGIASIIIQISLVGIGIICLSCYLVHSLRKPVQFYLFFGLVISLLVILPLHVVLNQSPVLWIIQLLLEDSRSIILVSYWIICCGFAVSAVNKQIENNKKATTSVRKTFHVIAVAIYLPGLIYKCTLLYLSSGVILGIFITLELLRVVKLPPLDRFLQDGFSMFVDEKDAGYVALTPIYLLVSVSAPLWLYPYSYDYYDNDKFNLLPLLSGILTIGVGDTAASVFGTLFGKHQWPDNQKTVEGTLSCIISQFALVFLLLILGCLSWNTIEFLKVSIGIIVTSMLEAFTTQVDNLVLPFVMFCILI